MRVLLVGINPGVLSARDRASLRGSDQPLLEPPLRTRHGPRAAHARRRRAVAEWGIGITNLVARPSPGIDDLQPAEYLEGWTILEKKIERFRPEIVAFVGVTMYRALWKVLGAPSEPPVIKPGFQKATVHGARLFVLPNPSGRNAHFSYHDMLAAFRALRRPIAGDQCAATGAASAARPLHQQHQRHQQQEHDPEQLEEPDERHHRRLPLHHAEQRGVGAAGRGRRRRRRRP